VTVSLSIIP